MTKKKILVLALSLAMVAILAVGGVLHQRRQGGERVHRWRRCH